MDDYRKEIDYSQVRISDEYDYYQLNYNPFPITAIAPGKLELPLFDDKIALQLDDFVIESYKGKQFGGLVIFGEYGFGKTYTLRHIQRKINEFLSERADESAVAVYIENPTASSQELITALLEHFGRHKFLTMLWKLVAVKFYENYSKFGEDFLKNFRTTELPIKKDINSLIDQRSISNPMVFLDNIYNSNIDFERISEFAKKEVFLYYFNHPEILNKLSKISMPNLDNSLREWFELLNYRTSKSSLKRYPKDEKFMNSILRVFHDNGYRQIFLLIDEFEDVTLSFSRTQARNYLSGLRALIQHNEDLFSIIVSTKLAEWEKMVRIHPALKDRFSYEIILEGCPKNKLVTFIENIMSEARPEGYNGIKISPFTNESLYAIWEITKNSPRLILELCRIVLKEGLNEKQAVIDEKFIEFLKSKKYHVMEPWLRAKGVEFDN